MNQQLLFLLSSLLEMVIPEVNKDMLSELEAMGFPTARATRALHYSGKSVAHVFLKDIAVMHL